MNLRIVLPLALSSALLAGCGSRAAPNVDADTEQQNGDERDALLNAVEEHPSIQNEDLAGPPIDVPTTIPPPAPGSMSAHHDDMSMNQPMPEDTNVQAPVDTNDESPPTN